MKSDLYIIFILFFYDLYHKDDTKSSRAPPHSTSLDFVVNYVIINVKIDVFLLNVTLYEMQ